MREVQNKSSVRMCAAKMHLVCMWDAWPMHEYAWISTHGAKCIKHITNDQNMINMDNYGDLQIFVLVEVQNNNKCHLGILSNT